MLYASILNPHGFHADFTADGHDARYEVRMENGKMVVHVRDGDGSVRLRLGDPLLSVIRDTLNRG